MNIKEIAQENLILKYPVGSHLYGTNTPTSDTDFCGVFIAPPEFYIGSRKVEEIDLSFVSKQENGRNDGDAIDFKLYEFKQFCMFAKECNPNIIEQLFVPKNQLLFDTPTGHKLRENFALFVSQKAKARFAGYAMSQRKKMIVKRDNMESILAAIDIFSLYNPKSYVAEHITSIAERMTIRKLQIKGTAQHLKIGDMFVQKNDTIKQAIRKFEERKSKFSGRHEDFVSKYGYDTKFASHLIRLLHEGREIISTGRLEFPLTYGQEIMDVKEGRWTIEEVLERSEELDTLMNEITPVVQKTCDHNLLDDFMTELVFEHWKNLCYI
jgi:predicted nucleotidyltransferase